MQIYLLKNVQQIYNKNLCFMLVLSNYFKQPTVLTLHSCKSFSLVLLSANLKNSSCSALSSSKISWQLSSSRKHRELSSIRSLVSSRRSLNAFIWTARLLLTSFKCSPLVSLIFLHSSVRSFDFSICFWNTGHSWSSIINVTKKMFGVQF